MKINTPIALLSALLLVTACKKENVKTTNIPAGENSMQADAVKQTQGTADFTTFIAVGDSQTAGYADDGLYNAGINASFPALMAQQMALLGGGAFNQPLFPTGQQNGSGYLKINSFAPSGLPVLGRVATSLGIRGSLGVPGLGTLPLFTKYAGNNNNYGVVGVKVADITSAQYGNINSYFERLLPLNTLSNTTSYLDYITAKPFTFFSCNIGNNDVLGYAIAGGGAESQLTDPTVFANNYDLLMNKLTLNGAKGIISTVPDVSSIPYFTTIQASALIAQVSASPAPFNTLYVSARTSSVLAKTGYTTRTLTADDMVLLTFDPTTIGKLVTVTGTTQKVPYGLSALAPIDSKYVLDPNEKIVLRRFVTAYNITIKGEAESKDLALFDAYSYLKNVNLGLTVCNIHIDATYLTGGIFSLDGVHLTPRGYALLAFKYDQAINTKYGSTLHSVNIANYPGVTYPL